MAVTFSEVPSRSFGDLYVYENTVYWSERSPQTLGRFVVFSYASTRHPAQQIWQETDEVFDVASEAYGYGGSAFAVAHGHLYFTCKKTGGLYQKPLKLTPGQKTVAELFFMPSQSFDATDKSTTPPLWTNLVPHPHCSDTLLAVCVAAGKPALVCVQKQKKTSTVFHTGADFYLDLAINPAGTQLCWLQGQEPHMAWDQTSLWRAVWDQTNHTCNKVECLFEKPEVSLYQPQWSLGGVLFFCSDVSGFWQIYRWDDTHGAIPATTISEAQAECGRPAWVAGTKSYGFWGVQGQEALVFTSVQRGLWRAFESSLTNDDQPLRPLGQNLEHIQTMDVGQGVAAFLGGSPREPLGIYAVGREFGHPSQHIFPEGISRAVCIRSSFEDFSFSQAFPEAPVPEAFSFLSKEGERVFALLYRPELEGPRPLIVRAHGGPTSASERLWNPRIQHYVRLGYAWVDLDYRGSVGYGRAYRKRLEGQWGLLDVDDMVVCAEALITAGVADRRACAAVGNSAGGLTALMALLKSSIYKCAAVSYPVTDLWALSQETHRFEKRYVEVLLGLDCLPNSTEASLQRHLQQRSPVGAAKPMVPLRGVLFFHGEKDRVVDIQQSISCAKMLEDIGFYCECHFFKDEGHGFKNPATLEMQLNKEAQFLQKWLDVEG